jgi:micrococcal nuclease
LKPVVVVASFVAVIAVVVALVAPRLQPERSVRDEASVVRVIDGDTIVVHLAKVDTTIRLLNVDAPETKDPNKAVECLGPEASRYLTRLLPPGTVVALEYDGERLDRYGRTLAGVFLDSSLVNAEIARAGLGVPVQYNDQVRFFPPVQEAAEEARRLRKGAYADDVTCALPARVATAVAALQSVDNPREETAAAYSVAIASLDDARSAARKARHLAGLAAGSSGAAAWVFHDAVRDQQRQRLDSAIRDADDRLEDLRSTRSTLQKQEAAERERRLERERAERAREERRRQARAAEQYTREDDDYSEQADRPSAGDSGGSGNDGYTGPRCYEPGGKVWHPC